MADRPRGQAELVADADHLQRVVSDGLLTARSSLEIATADLKAMLTPAPQRRRAPSIIEHFHRLGERGVEIRVLHAGVPSAAARRELKARMPAGLTIRRCPRWHGKLVIVDCRAMYLGSANLTGAGLGAKADDRRNFELGLWTRSAELIDAALERFNHVWEGVACETCKRHDICPVPLEEPRL